MIKIVIGGDTCPIGRNEPLFRRGDADGLLGDLQPQFEAADLVIANLECPLIEKEAPIAKCGPNLGAPVDCVKGLKAIGIDVVGLANNHIMDHGPQGLRTTIQTLDQESIGHVGAGENLEQARRVLIREVNGVRVGILAVAEHEFGIAEGNAAGGNPLDVIDAVRNIDTHRSEFDCLIVLLHGGNEFYPYPRPGLMDTCRFLVEQGANAVICQQSHCAGCMEIYREAPIVYGQGNFLFDYPSNASTWHEGALVILAVNANGGPQVQLIPYVQSDAQPGARRMPEEQADRLLHAFNDRSQCLDDESSVLAQWQRFCREKKRSHLHMLNHPPSLLRRLLGKADLLHYLDSREKQRMRLHALRCESLREALIAVLSAESRK